jgi:CubicO group peptidase (beta-lactamase class C family)
MNKGAVFVVLATLLLQGCSHEPDTTGNGFQWPVSTPAAQGLDRQKIRAAYNRAGLLGTVDALLVIRNGHLVAEEYYNGYSRNTPHQLWSVTKSFLSACVGIALEQGFIDDIDNKVIDYFPEYAFEGMDPRFSDITVRNLLAMRMGIDREQNNLIAVVSTDIWLRETFRLPLLYDPGTKFSYNSLQSLLLSAIITKTSGMNAGL